MIFVTVGLHDQPFDRLVRAADELAGLGEEQVVIQRGCSRHLPVRATSFEWASFQEMQAWVGRARVVVAQAGAGTMLMTLKVHKPLVVVARLRQHQENHNDHQLQLASALAARGGVVHLTDLSGEGLRLAVEQAGRLPPVAVDSSSLRTALAERLATWQAGRRGGR